VGLREFALPNAPVRPRQEPPRSKPERREKEKIESCWSMITPLSARVLAELISRQADLTICGEAGDVHEAFTLIAKLRPDMAVIDVSLKNASGLELIKTLKVQDPNLPAAGASMHDESLYAERALRAGALGYVMKQEPSH